MTICPECGHHNPDNMSFCEQCGHKLTENITVETSNNYCPKCHQPVAEGQAFCDNCGEKLASHETITTHHDPSDWRDQSAGAASYATYEHPSAESYEPSYATESFHTEDSAHSYHYEDEWDEDYYEDEDSFPTRFRQGTRRLSPLNRTLIAVVTLVLLGGIYFWRYQPQAVFSRFKDAITQHDYQKVAKLAHSDTENWTADAIEKTINHYQMAGIDLPSVVAQTNSKSHTVNYNDHTLLTIDRSGRLLGFIPIGAVRIEPISLKFTGDIQISDVRVSEDSLGGIAVDDTDPNHYYLDPSVDSISGQMEFEGQKLDADLALDYSQIENMTFTVPLNTLDKKLTFKPNGVVSHPDQFKIVKASFDGRDADKDGHIDIRSFTGSIGEAVVTYRYGESEYTTEPFEVVIDDEGEQTVQIPVDPQAVAQYDDYLNTPEGRAKTIEETAKNWVAEYRSNLIKAINEQSFNVLKQYGTRSEWAQFTQEWFRNEVSGSGLRYGEGKGFTVKSVQENNGDIVIKTDEYFDTNQGERHSNKIYKIRPRDDGSYEIVSQDIDHLAGY